MKKNGLLYVEDLKELFEDVQKGRIFGDQKFFADCIPKCPVDELLRQYRHEKKKPGFRLKDFCRVGFEFPADDGAAFVSDPSQSVEEHINRLWKVLTKEVGDTGGSLIRLPHPFVVPGGRFREVYYWDSYFTMLGLQVAGRMDLIENMVDNFAYLIDKFGFIPNANRSYFLSRSQPPFFSLMVELLSEENQKHQAFVKYLPQMEKEYQYWMAGSDTLEPLASSCKRVVRMPDGATLNRYWDDLDKPRPEAYADDLQTSAEKGDVSIGLFRNIRAAAESGWDFSSRWFRTANDMSTISTTEIIPVDLNCLLHRLESTLSLAYQLTHDYPISEKYRDLSAKREAAIQKYLWDETRSCFMDYDIVRQTAFGQPSAVMTFPLFSGIATSKQGAAVARQVELHFLKPGGLVTTLSRNGQQWDAPNGWAPIQWYAFKGLMDYGFENIAGSIRTNWLGTIDHLFKASGKLTEKYNVIETKTGASGGEYPNQDGFGWTNGVYLKLKSV